MERGIRLYIIYSGPFGEQMINNYAANGLGDKIVCLYQFEPETIEGDHPSNPDILKKIWDEPEKYVPRDLPLVECDLLVVLGIHPLLGDIIPTIAQRLKAKAVIYPLDDSKRVPEGLKTIKDDLDNAGIYNEFPRPYCVIEQSGNGLINYMCQKVGRPKFKIEFDERMEVIKKVEVLRDTPCGSAHSVAKKLEYVSYKDKIALKEKIMIEHSNEGNENYCLASMDPIEPLMQEAGDVLVEAVFEACGFPILKDFLLEEVKKRREVSIDELKRLFVSERKLCDAQRTVERTINKLVSLGKIRRRGENKNLLTLA